MTDEKSTLTARFLAPLIARALGKEWSVTPDNDPHDHNASIAHVSGAKVVFRSDQYGDKGKLVCYGWGAYSPHSVRIEGKHEIRVSVERGAGVIARELTRRLLPDYLAAFAKQGAAIAEYEAMDRAIERTAMELWAHAGKVGNKPWRSNGRGPMRFYSPGGGTVVVHSATSVEIEVRGVHPQAARNILTVLAKHAIDDADEH